MRVRDVDAEEIVSDARDHAAHEERAAGIALTRVLAALLRIGWSVKRDNVCRYLLLGTYTYEQNRTRRHASVDYLRSLNTQSALL